MIPKKHKLNQKEFKEVFDCGHKLTTPLFLFIYEQAVFKTQLSFVVPKKIAPKAAERNKLRRKGYSALAESLPAIKKPIRGIFITRRPFVQAQREDVVRLIKSTFKRIG